ncbi:MAG: hypothetical protein LBK82_06215, partial [Planctomycetaceae bacterium]|jgi:hypothetical protein|nr:hypothetical protein [Planctomycetaceae bacterium]
MLKGISTMLISAYWGYGGTTALLVESTRETINMNDHNFLTSIIAILIQLLILVTVSIMKLMKEKV